MANLMKKFFTAGVLFFNFPQFFFTQTHSSFAIFFPESIHDVYTQEVMHFLAEQA